MPRYSLLLVLAATATMPSACAPAMATDADVCQAAADHLATCYAEERFVADSCDVAVAEDVLSRSCDDMDKGAADWQNLVRVLVGTRPGLAATCNLTGGGCHFFFTVSLVDEEGHAIVGQELRMAQSNGEHSATATTPSDGEVSFELRDPRFTHEVHLVTSSGEVTCERDISADESSVEYLERTYRVASDGAGAESCTVLEASVSL